MDDMKIAACYIRVSTDDQTEYSPDSQLKLLRDYAKSHGLILPEEFVFMEKEGVSGRKAEKRPEFQRMISAAKSPEHPFDVILVWKYSRFARNQEESIVYKSMLHRECGVNVTSISEPLIDGPFGGLIERIIEWMDEYYSIRLAGEVTRGMKESISRGNHVNGTPFGYMRKEGKLIPDPEKSPLVKQIFQWYLDGYGCRQIAGILNDMGIKSKYGNRMENRTVEYILCNPVYIGKLRWGGDGWFRRDFQNPDILVFDGAQEPLIDLETWNAVQKKIKETKERYGYKQKQTAPHEYFLRGMIKCSNCGATLTRSTANGLQCTNYSKNSCSVSHYIGIEKAENIVLEALKEDILSGKQTAEFAVRPRAVPSAKDPTKQLIRQEQRKLQRVREAYENGIDSLEEYRANKEKITARIAKLEKRLKADEPPKDITAEFYNRAKNAMQVILSPDYTPYQKNDALRSFVDHIVFDRKKSSFTLFYYF